ncbi:MAG: DNA-binding protein [Clostridiaceae bacterium]|nr:DNA-binding protein [Eubacteriales bacterium]
MEKRTYLCCLLEFYGALLTARQRTLMEQHLYEDCSLFEIAEREGITRQGVRDALVRAERELNEAEEKLGFFARNESIKGAVEALGAALKEAAVPPEARKLMNNLKEICEEIAPPAKS